MPSYLQGPQGLGTLSFSSMVDRLWSWGLPAPCSVSSQISYRKFWEKALIGFGLHHMSICEPVCVALDGDLSFSWPVLYHLHILVVESIM